MIPDNYKNEIIEHICRECSSVWEPEDSYCGTTCPLTQYVAVRKYYMENWDKFDKLTFPISNVFEKCILKLEEKWQKEQDWFNTFTEEDCDKETNEEKNL